MATVESRPRYFSQRLADAKMMLDADVHLGTKNADPQMKQYIFKCGDDGIYIINLIKTWHMLQLAAREIVAIENPQNIIVRSASPYGQRAVLKFAQYTGAHAIAGSHTPGTFTNQLHTSFGEPRLLIVTDPRTDHQHIEEAALANIRTIAFCDTDSPMRYVDIVTPASIKGKHSLGCLFWLIARMVLQMRGTIPPGLKWDVMVDLFYREPEEAKQLEEDEIAAPDYAIADFNASAISGDMMDDADERWLYGVAHGIVDGTHQLQTPPPSPLPQGGPIGAPFIQQVADDARGEDEIRVDAEGLVNDGNGVPTVNLEDSEVEEVPLVSRKRKHAGGEDGQTEKRKHKSKFGSHRSGSSSRYRSFALDEEFAKKTYEEYMADPLAAAIHTIVHLSDLAKEEKIRSELRMKEIQAEKDAEKNAKETALNELDWTRNLLKMTTLTLVTLRQNLKVLEKLRDDLSRENAVEKDKVSGLEARIQELVKTDEAQNLEVQRLTSKVAELEKALESAPAEAESSGNSTRIAELAKELKAKNALLAQSEEKAQKTAHLALKMKEKYFNLALDQVMVVNPSMGRLKAVFNPSHGVEEGKIVSVDQTTKQKVVIYSTPAHN